MGTPSALSIPLWCDWDWDLPMSEFAARRTFNPTVVRLGLYCQALGHTVLYTFNPTVVRLGRQECWLLDDGGHPFNPTVVRLGPSAPSTTGGLSSVFQSHCGAIGTWRGSHDERQNHSFQSHCGAIGTRRVHVAFLGHARLSIPLWCDWDQAPATAVAPTSNLSIPLWCDWDIAPSLTAPAKCPPFNPTVVRLGRWWEHVPPELITELSIPLWCDWDRDALPDRGLVAALSIPLWCDWDATASGTTTSTVWNGPALRSWPGADPRC